MLFIKEYDTDIYRHVNIEHIESLYVKHRSVEEWCVLAVTGEDAYQVSPNYTSREEAEAGLDKFASAFIRFSGDCEYGDEEEEAEPSKQGLSTESEAKLNMMMNVLSSVLAASDADKAKK